jgi:hypothetical protein
MKTCLVVLVCVILAATFAFAQAADEGFQPARVVSIDRVPADARHPEKADQYKVSMRMGDVLYLCQSSAPPSAFLDWSPNKEFPAKLDGKMLLVNGPHGQVPLNITGKKTAR